MPVKLILGIIYVVITIVFIGFNLDNKTSVWLIQKYNDVPVFLVALIGVGTGLFFSLPYIIFRKNEITEEEIEKYLAKKRRLEEKAKKEEEKIAAQQKKAEEKEQKAAEKQAKLDAKKALKEAKTQAKIDAITAEEKRLEAEKEAKEALKDEEKSAENLTDNAQ